MKLNPRLPFRILVTRTDRLGDVILATPVLSALKKIHPAAEIFFLVQKSWMPVLQYQNAIQLIEYDPNESVKALSQKLRGYGFNRCYVLRDEKKVSRAVWQAGIPERIGPYSTLRSFLFFNRGKLQSRARCKMHEAEYNLDLLTSIRPASGADELPRAWIATNAAAQESAEQFLEKENLKPKSFFVIHPGSSGSARYVKQTELHRLARALIYRGNAVCVSGGPAEDTLIDEFVKAVPNVHVLAKQNALGLDGMAEVYRLSLAVIAHGTGPLHLAAAVGTPVLAIFSPIFVLSEKRWGPLVSKRSVWTPPDVFCPAVYRCIGEKCEYYDCMDRFSIDEAIKRLEKIT
jgi:ADP-heptose:LPS heptosyltransferase